MLKTHERGSPATSSAIETRFLPHVKVGCVPVFRGRASVALRTCLDRLNARQGIKVATANLDFLAIARRDQAAGELLQRFDLVVADGAPVAWLASLASRQPVERLAGVDLAQQLLHHSRRPVRVFLYGGKPEVARRAAAVIQERYPTVAHVETYSPPFRPLTPMERAEDEARIMNAKCDIVLVALGFPRQEHFIEAFFDSAPHAVWIGVGGTLDFLAGRRKRAPRLLQLAGLEWTVRLAQEPGRLWRRYFLRDAPEMARATIDVFRRRGR